MAEYLIAEPGEKPEDDSVDACVAAVLAIKTDGRMRDDLLPESVRHNNTLCAQYAAQSVRQMAELTKLGEEPVDIAVTDLIGNLQHFCDAVDVDFDDALGQARRRYAEESSGRG